MGPPSAGPLKEEVPNGKCCAPVGVRPLTWRPLLNACWGHRARLPMNLLKRAFLLGAVALASAQNALATPAKPAAKAPVRKPAAKAPVRKAAAGKAPAASQPSRPAAPLRSPVLLTISGAIKKHNRGALDKAVDQMAYKHGLAFEQAYTFDAAALANLPAETIQPTLEYDEKVQIGRAHV